MKKELNELIEWMGLRIAENDCQKLAEIFHIWNICSAKDLKNKLDSLNQLEIFSQLETLRQKGTNSNELSPEEVLFRDSLTTQKALFMDMILSLLKTPYPFYRPDHIRIEFEKSDTERDTIPEHFRAFTQTRFWRPDCIYEKDSGKNIWYDREDFEVIAEDKVEIKKMESLDQIEYSEFDVDGTEYKRTLTFKPEILAIEDLKASPKRFTNYYIIWKKTPPCPGVMLIADLVFSPPSDHNELDLKLTKDTSWFSPLGQLTLTSEDIIRPASEWKTFLQFQIANRFTSYIPITGDAPTKSNRTGQAKFIEALSPKNENFRISLEDREILDIPNQYYFPYNSGNQKFISHHLKNVYHLISDELVYKGIASRKATSRTTREELEVINEIKARGEKSIYSKAHFELIDKKNDSIDIDDEQIDEQHRPDQEHQEQELIKRANNNLRNKKYRHQKRTKK